MALTVKNVERLKTPGRHLDGKGLYLQISDGGARSWIFRYERAGKERMMGLGAVSDYTLDEAREAARQARRKIKDGIDPIDDRAVERAARVAEAAKQVAQTITFEKCARQYHKEHRHKWRNEKYGDDWLASLEHHAFAKLGALSVGAIDTPLVLETLKPIWNAKPTTASRVRARIEEVLDCAFANGWRTGDNPASWDILRHALPDPDLTTKAEHMAALPYKEVRAFMTELRAVDGIPARALEFAILTCARSTELRLAVWSEIDLTNKTWTLPKQRIKGGAEHRVPLCPRAVEILEGLPREAEWVWVGPRRGQPMAFNAARSVAQKLRPDITLHGFRSTFRDWAAESTNFPRELAEKALAHLVGNEVERAYQRGDLLEKRRRLMEAWAEYCGAKPAKGGTLLPFSKAG